MPYSSLRLHALVLLAASALAVPGCDRLSTLLGHKADTSSSPVQVPLVPSKAAPHAPVPTVYTHAPLGMGELATTNGQIALDNLVGNLRSAEAFAQVRPTDTVVRSRVLLVLLTLGQYRGTLADYQRAEDLLPSLIELGPNDGQVLLTRAQIRSVFHDFDAALEDLAQAEKLNPELSSLVIERRANIWAATGKLDEALAVYRMINAKRKDISTVASEAALIGETGDLAAAEKMFIEAPQYFRDVSPFPMAWLYFQQGLMWEQADNLPRARELYAAAVERLPSYAAAVAHLAGAEAARNQRESAIALLRPLITVSDDPEYKGQLAELLQQSGDSVGATKLLTEAQQQYAVLLAKHPRAFAHHAALFYLGPAKDPKTAAVWAEKNLTYFQTPLAFLLGMEAALATANSARACALAESLSKRLYLSVRTHVVMARAFTACGQKDRAARELQAVTAKLPIPNQ